MKVSLKSKIEKRNGSSVLILPEADKKLNKLKLPIEIKVLPTDNFDKTAYFAVSPNGLLTVHPDEDGNVDGILLRLIANNIQKLYSSKILDRRGIHYFYNRSEMKALIWLADNFDSKTWSKSPHSDSYYNSKNIGWGHKPEKSLRISNHWNFNTYNEMENGIDDGRHCPTHNPNFKSGWAIGQFKNGKYTIIKKF